MNVTAIFDIGKTNKKFFLLDERYEVAMGLARGAYKNAIIEDEFDSGAENNEQPMPPGFDEGSFNPETETF